MIQKYRNICDEVDRKILRPISFDNAKSLYTFLRYLIIRKKIKIYIYFSFCRNHSYHITGFANDSAAPRYNNVVICCRNGNDVYLSANQAHVTYYTNKDRDILVYVENGLAVHRTFIIK